MSYEFWGDTTEPMKRVFTGKLGGDGVKRGRGDGMQVPGVVRQKEVWEQAGAAAGSAWRLLATPAGTLFTQGAAGRPCRCSASGYRFEGSRTRFPEDLGASL